jgi:hypothetical protein
MAPTQEALAKRAGIRTEISRYKADHGIG